MSRSIRAAVFSERGSDGQLTEVLLDEPGPGEVLVKVVASGVCHTDSITRDGDLPQPLPGILGHEGAGIVAAIGPDVTEVVVGDRVVMGWPSCGSCEHCQAGEPRYCDRLGEALVGGHRLLGPKAGQTGYRLPDGTPIAGHFFGQSSFAEYSLALASALVKIDDDVPFELAGPLACGITTGAGAVFHTAQPKPGDTMVIWGAGAVGLAAVMAAANSPVTTIIVVDLNPDRLALATSFGASHVINARTEDAVARVKEICGGPATFSIECTGVISVVEQAIEAVGMLGTTILIGGAPAEARFSVDHLGALWGKRIVGTLGGSGRSQVLIPTLLNLWRQGRFPFDRLIETFPFEDFNTAMHEGSAGRVVKPVLQMKGE
ncbi:MAG: NAD(P)-dependent alcohol dehydrogenase [Microbacteriaceae bacterium]